MGLLTDLGPIQNFQTSKNQQKTIKIIGIKQFLHRLKLYATWTKPKGLQFIKWGQQIEGNFLKRNSQGQLELCKENISQQYNDVPFPIVYEYGSWMFEMIPKLPHSTTCNFFDYVISIRQKYDILRNKSRMALTIPLIPFLGIRYPNKEEKYNNQITQSLYIDDNHIANHPRFRTLTKHVRLRRGHTVEMNVPILKDTNTDPKQLSLTEPNPDFIHMDAMAFGMGACCLQCTFSTKDFDHARYVYDQLNVLSPIFLALTAGTPFFKGKVADWDVRWNVISGSVDDRTQKQRDPTSNEYIPTSRYGSANYFLWDSPVNRPQYNDFYTGVREQDIALIRNVVEKESVPVDQKMIFHLANIFRRDYLIVHQKFKDMDVQDFLLFDMINGTNWNSVRLKVPTHDDIGWRVQFRTMEVQLTADENAAYSILIHLITRILHQNNDLNFYIPISKIRQNFERAHLRDAISTQKFYFRTNIYGDSQPIIEELTVTEILFGKGNYKGIFHEIDRRVEGCVKMCSHVNKLINQLKQFIWNTATGKRLTLASWMRKYVNEHPQYTHNSILSKKVMDDLLSTLHRIESRQIEEPNFDYIFSKQTEVAQPSKGCFYVESQAILVGK